MEREFIINHANELAYKTYSYLRVNEKKLNLGQWSFEKQEEVKNPDFLKNYSYGLSKEVCDLHKEYTNLYEVYKSDEILDFGVKDRQNQDVLVETVDFLVEEKADLQGFISTRQKAGSFHSSMYRIHVKKDAHAKIYLSNHAEKGTTSLISLAIVLEEGAKLELFHYQMGHGDLVMNVAEYLQGEHSEGKIHSMYLGMDSQNLDFLYDIIHEGKMSVSDLQVNGALMENAFKVFKSRLDFMQKSSGSVGNEEEYAILLDDTAKSLSVPSLLSHEDDVEGNHAASAGHIDPRLLYYIMSRGFSEEEAERLVIDSRFAPTIDAIVYEEKRQELYEELQTILEARHNVQSK